METSGDTPCLNNDMAIFRSRNQLSSVKAPVDSNDYISPNYLSGSDFTYNPNTTLQDSYTGGVLSRNPRTTIQHTYDTRLNKGWASNFYYRYRYFYQGTEFFSALSLGALSTERDISIDIFSGFKDKHVVSSISVPSGAGISVTNLSTSDRVQPYSTFSVDLNIAKDGPTNVSDNVVVEFGNGMSWVIGISFTRVTLPITLLDANWKEGLTLTRSFMTSVFKAQSMAETRKALRRIPVRKQSSLLTFSDKESSLRAWAAARETLAGTFYFPLFVDESNMTAVNDGQKIFCPVDYRRFEVGQQVLLRHKFVAGDASSDIYGSQILTISAIESDGLVLAGETLEAYESGDRVYPLVQCMANAASVQQNAFTDRKGSMSIEITELWGPDAYELENDTYTPTELAGLPVFDYRINEGEDTQIEIMHGGGTVNSGRGFVTDLYGQYYQSQTFRVFAESREKYWDILGFFNYIKGRSKPFWVKQYLNMLSLSGQSGDVYSFDSNLKSADIENLEYLWVSDASGNQDVVKVLSIADTSEGFDLTCSTSTSVTTATDARQALAVRQTSDELVEDWITLEAVEFSFTVEEVQGIYTA